MQDHVVAVLVQHHEPVDPTDGKAIASRLRELVLEESQAGRYDLSETERCAAIAAVDEVLDRIAVQLPRVLSPEIRIVCYLNLAGAISSPLAPRTDLASEIVRNREFWDSLYPPTESEAADGPGNCPPDDLDSRLARLAPELWQLHTGNQPKRWCWDDHS